MAAQTYNPNTWEAAAGLPGVQGQPGLWGETIPAY